MILTVASYKGGVGKTTTAMHLAAWLNGRLPTLLLDGDPTQNATAWAQRAAPESSFPVRVESIEMAARLAGVYREGAGHIVIDSGQRPEEDELAKASKACDLLVIPAVPTSLDTDGLVLTIAALRKIGATNYRVLLTRVAPDASRQAAELRQLLADYGAPTFATSIPRLKAFEKAAGEGTTVRGLKDPNAERAWQANAAAGEELAL